MITPLPQINSAICFNLSDLYNRTPIPMLIIQNIPARKGRIKILLIGNVISLPELSREFSKLEKRKPTQRNIKTKKATEKMKERLAIWFSHEAAIQSAGLMV